MIGIGTRAGFYPISRIASVWLLAFAVQLGQLSSWVSLPAGSVVQLGQLSSWVSCPARSVLYHFCV